MALVSVCLGLRVSEMLALKWSDVDWLGARLSIQRGIVNARVARLVFGATDDKAGAAGSLWDVVRDRRLNHRPEVVAGVLADESARLLQDFFAQQR